MYWLLFCFLVSLPYLNAELNGNYSAFSSVSASYLPTLLLNHHLAIPWYNTCETKFYGLYHDLPKCYSSIHWMSVQLFCLKVWMFLTTSHFQPKLNDYWNTIHPKVDDWLLLISLYSEELVLKSSIIHVFVIKSGMYLFPSKIGCFLSSKYGMHYYLLAIQYRMFLVIQKWIVFVKLDAFWWNVVAYMLPLVIGYLVGYCFLKGYTIYKGHGLEMSWLTKSKAKKINKSITAV